MKISGNRFHGVTNLNVKFLVTVTESTYLDFLTGIFFFKHGLRYRKAWLSRLCWRKRNADFQTHSNFINSVFALYIVFPHLMFILNRCTCFQFFLQNIKEMKGGSNFGWKYFLIVILSVTTNDSFVCQYFYNKTSLFLQQSQCLG